MIIDLFEAEFRARLCSVEPKSATHGVAIQLRMGADPDQPISLVSLKFRSPAVIRATISRRLNSEERAVYFARRLGSVWPIMERFCGSNFFRAGSADLSLDDHEVRSGLSFCARSRNSYLIPDPIFMFHRGYEDVRLHYADNARPWTERKSVAFWRGATTGPSVDDWRNLPRVKLCELSSSHPDLVDAGVTKCVQKAVAHEADIRAAGYMKTYVPPQQFGEWRYQVDIDGNTNSWPGLFQKLLTGSTVLKVQSARGWRQWYYDRMLPGVHFVAVSPDMSDLLDRIAWLQTHDDEARAIGAAGRALAFSMTYDTEVAAAAATIAAALGGN